MSNERVSRRWLNKRIGGTAFGIGFLSLFGGERIAKNKFDALTHETGSNGGIMRQLTNEEIDDNILNNDEWTPPEGASEYFLDAVKAKDYDRIRGYVQFEEAPAGSAEASCIPGGCYYQYQNRSSTDCTNYGGVSCWTRRVCCAACGCGWVYYAWQRVGCGYC